MLSKENKSMKVLHIEDTEFFRQIFIKALENINPSTEYISYDNCTDALSYLEKADSPPHFIFLDLGMPDMPGKKCLKEIRKMNHCMDIPVIIFTESLHLTDEEETKKLGANFYFYKDRNFGSICDSIRLVFSAKKLTLTSVL
jgi:DNA-binding NarL/FixJ family response regulator